MKTPFYILAAYGETRFAAAICYSLEDGKKASELHEKATDLVQVRTHEDLKDLSTSVLLALVNFVKQRDGQTPLKRFRDRRAAMTMGYTAMTSLLAPKAAATDTTTSQEQDMAKKKPEAEPTEAESTEAATETETENEAESTEAVVLTAEQEARLAELNEKDKEIRAEMDEAGKSYKAFINKSREDLNLLRKERLAISKKPRAGGPKRAEGGETETVTMVLDLLRRDEGATKKQLIEGVPQAKPAYISALLTGILAKKGYVLEGTTVEGQKGKTYRVMGRRAEDAAA